MKIQRAEKSAVRKILIGMIVDSAVLGRVAGKWDKKHGLFADDWPNLIGGWAVKYFDKYGKAPGKAIESYFSDWAEHHENVALVKLVEKFMATLSGQYKAMRKELNSDYIIDEAIKHFNRVRLEKLAEQVQKGLDTGKVDEAYKMASAFGKLEMGIDNMVKPFEDKAMVKKAFAERRKPLFHYAGKSLRALDNFFQDTFERDALVGFMGPEKRGKTWWLIDAAWRAMLQGRRVAFFEIGDLSQNQMQRRLMIRASGRPWKPKTVRIPTSIEPPGHDSLPELEFDERKFKHSLKRTQAWEACQRVVKKSGKDLFRLWVFPNGVLSVAGVQAELRMAERQDWTPDVLLIDYADLFAPMPGYAADSQDQIDVAWRALRSMSQQYHCCVITATQSDAASYYVETLDKSHFSRDKRKFAHVTAMIGINQNKEEKRQGLYRLNQLVIRESEYEEEKCVHVAGCLALANPAIRATF